MAEDFRVKVGFFGHPKTVKLRRRVGSVGVERFLWLWDFCAQYRHDGNLSGLDNEEIEIAAHWEGEPGELVQALTDVGYLDEVSGGLRIHDFGKHQPFVSTEPERSTAGRRSALIKWHKKGSHAEKPKEDCPLCEVTKPAEERRYGAGNSSTGRAAPLPSPSPTPTPTPNPLPLPSPEHPHSDPQVGDSPRSSEGLNLGAINDMAVGVWGGNILSKWNSPIRDGAPWRQTEADDAMEEARASTDGGGAGLFASILIRNREHGGKPGARHNGGSGGSWSDNPFADVEIEE